jgi:hypothetical protein
MSERPTFEGAEVPDRMMRGPVNALKDFAAAAVDGAVTQYRRRADELLALVDSLTRANHRTTKNRRRIYAVHESTCKPPEVRASPQTSELEFSMVI